MPLFKNYDPFRVAASFKGVPWLGYAEGSMIKVARDVDTYSKEVGAQGDVTRVRSRNRSGSITGTFQAASPTNDAMSALAKADELIGLSYGVFLLRDFNGTTLLVAQTAWIKRPADVDYGDTGGNREWMLECSELEMFVGGAVF